jgi:hypothetical protein
MKSLLITLTLTLSLGAFAQTAQQADDLYSARGIDANKALEAATAYTTLAAATANKAEKATFLNEASKSYYFVGTSKSSDDQKKKYHIMGMNVAQEAIDTVLTFTNATEKEQLAMGYFRFGSNQGKWAEANGIASSLGKWPSLKTYMKNIIKLGYKSLEAYGAYRILGRAYYKLPAPLGSKKKALKYLETAFNGSMNGNDISNYGLNVNFYAQTLISLKRKDEARKILNSFIQKDAATFNTARIPETKVEIQEAKKILKEM